MAPITTRHCLYHVYPWRWNDHWRENVDVLSLWSDEAFNGRRIAAIATHHSETVPYDQVAARMESLGFECHEFRNDEQLREVATFVPLLRMVESTDPTEAVFYAHTKGNTTRDGKIGAKIWRNVAYRELVRDWRRCVDLLQECAAVGIHRIAWGDKQPPYPTRLNHGTWMFAGTFFWFRSDRVYSIPTWGQLPADRYAAEAWLSGLFSVDETRSVYQLWPERQYPTPSPYWPMTYPEADQKWEPRS